ncbi:hypothetical protein LINPERHAP1_LOCUS29554 [Linum perenne]
MSSDGEQYMENNVASLTLEEEELVFDQDVVPLPGNLYDLCLVCFLLTNKQYNFPAFQSRMAGLWCPGRGVSFKEIGDMLMIILFNHVVDLCRVLELGPWIFYQSLLILHELKPGENPNTLDLKTATFRVQVHDLPPGFYSEIVGKALGNFIGRFIEYDEHNMVPFDRDFMRLKVELDVCCPLKREKKIRAAGGDTSSVMKNSLTSATSVARWGCVSVDAIGHSGGLAILWKSSSMA